MAALDPSVLKLRPNPLDRLLWADDLTMVPLGGEEESIPLLGRRLEVFLDALLCFASDVHGYLLHAAFDGALTDPERQLRDLLLDLQRRAGPEVRSTASWAVVAQALNRLGREGSPGTTTPATNPEPPPLRGLASRGRRPHRPAPR